MKCSNCSNEMIVGQTSISATAGGFLIFGLSYKNLVFKSNSIPSRKVQSNNETKSAYFCNNCESVFIKNSSSRQYKKVGKYTYETEEGDDLSKIVP